MTDKWDARFLSLARLVATWSKDPSSKVGAVIVDAKNRVNSLGFNGFPRTVSDAPQVYADREEKLRRTLHAEQNALLFAARSVEGGTIYITHPPCARCAALLIQSGVKRVVCPPPPPDFQQRWGADIASSRQMFDEAQVDFVEIV